MFYFQTHPKDIAYLWLVVRYWEFKIIPTSMLVRATLAEKRGWQTFHLKTKLFVTTLFGPKSFLVGSLVLNSKCDWYFPLSSQ